MIGDFNLLADNYLLAELPSQAPIFNGVIEVTVHPYLGSAFPDNIATCNASIVRLISASAVYVPMKIGGLSAELGHKTVYATAFKDDLYYTNTNLVLSKSISATASFTPQMLFIGDGGGNLSRPEIDVSAIAFDVFNTDINITLPSLTTEFVVTHTPPVFAGVGQLLLPHKTIAATSIPTKVFSGNASLLIRPRILTASYGVYKYNRFPFRITVNMVRNDDVQPPLTLYVGDHGIPFEVQVKSFDSKVLSLKEADFYQFMFQRPQESTIITRQPGFLYNGEDGILVYHMTEDDLSVYGTWRFQLMLGFNGDVKLSEIQKFKVRQSLPLGV